MACPAKLGFRVAGWSAWTESMAEADAWSGLSAKSDSYGRPQAVCYPPADLPMMLRRRASPLGRSALAAAMGIPEVEDARYIMSSRHGELARTTRILNSLAAEEPLSPADFSMSVHHGLVGLLSIAARNRKGHSAVSAGQESFCYGLLEAAACTVESPDEPVILLHYDERPGNGFAALFEESKTGAPTVAAMCLRGMESSGGTAVTMHSTAHHGSPECRNHAVEFLQFLVSGANGTSSPGRRAIWEWSRA